MSLKKWLLNKGLFYLFIFGIFYIVGEMLGIVPEPLKNVVSWLANNFLLISFLLVSFMVFLIVMRLISKPRSGQT
jgi:hypothetical protein